MARIPDEELIRLKQEVSVQRLAEARGVKLRRSGDSLLCKFRGKSAGRCTSTRHASYSSRAQGTGRGSFDPSRCMHAQKIR
jgi:hypothetical protein